MNLEVSQKIKEHIQQCNCLLRLRAKFIVQNMNLMFRLVLQIEICMSFRINISKNLPGFTKESKIVGGGHRT